MDNQTLEKRIIDYVAKTYRADGATLSRDTKIREELSDQSMLMVALVSLIENELDVMIPLHGAAKIETIGDLIDHVAKELS